MVSASRPTGICNPARGAGIRRAHGGQHAVTQRELALPDRQQHIDQIRIAVVERVIETGHGERARRAGAIGRDGLAGVAVNSPMGCSMGVQTSE